MIIIPKDKNKANTYMYQFAKLFQRKIKNESSYMSKKKYDFFGALKFTPPPLDFKSQNNPLSNPRTPRSK